nr:nitronate monooxygenase [Micromonospora sp. DSM 115978]
MTNTTPDNQRRPWSTGRLEDLLGIDAPIVQGPFGGGLSSVQLAAAVSNAGGLGSYGAHALTPREITDVVADLRAATDRSFAVNLWVPQPGEPDRPSPADVAGHAARARPVLEELRLPVPSADQDYEALPTFADQAEA